MNWKLFVLLLITLVVLVACSEDDQTEDTNVTAEDQETKQSRKRIPLMNQIPAKALLRNPSTKQNYSR